MSIRYTTKSIFDSSADVLVCPSNCVGVMGAGLALQFKIKFPVMFKLYHQWCKECLLQPGEVYTIDIDHKPICIFTTKDDWRLPSQLLWIENGLEDFVEKITDTYYDFFSKYKSFSFPLLGCGLGGLEEDYVLPLMEKYLGRLKYIDILIHRRK